MGFLRHLQCLEYYLVLSYLICLLYILSYIHELHSRVSVDIFNVIYDVLEQLYFSRRLWNRSIKIWETIIFFIYLIVVIFSNKTLCL